MATETWSEPGRPNGPTVGWQPGYGTRELGETGRGELIRPVPARPYRARRGDGAAGRPLTTAEQRIVYDDKALLQAEWDARREAYEREADRRHLIEREREREAPAAEAPRRVEARRPLPQPRDWIQHTPREEATSTLIRDFMTEAQYLASQEIRLAKAELRHEAQAAAKGASNIGIGGVMAFVGLLALTGCVITALAAAIPLWLSALLIGGFMVLVGAMIAMGGMAKLRALNPKPERTAESLKEDREWASGLKRDVQSRRRVHA